MSSKRIKLAQDVLTIEANEILKASSKIANEFSEAVESIIHCKGRIILSGIGKSGHIAGKIASTLSSTGTPSFFMHPGEASHGDLGMITDKDIVIFLSNSGESQELIVLLPLIKRIGAKIISITGDTNSTLFTESNIHISSSVTKEACPLGLAPTASTSLMLALGDALAICVLNERNFDTEDFVRSHPGGSLGKIVHIEDIMINLGSTPRISLESSIEDAIKEITTKKLGFTAVVDNQNIPKGIFTDGDLRRLLLNHTSLETPISKVLKKKPITLSKKQMAIEALKIMEKQKITSFLIIEKDKSLVGSLTLQSLFKAKIL
ncbi:KpsF/GutQ family sugar-phosphate isomerase [Methylophilaceae bacterium]|nr:KpsF/GutQ family sugar-phosphate isomerase [Methylophilaceae bacterium]|tara:strand:- start:1857 stop:2816 length:960 start_codon:yes stop_codon:yes gene_type:complete